ncbi:MAG: hypothetical protein ACKVX7_04090, partial [Planctomycetota bacterium]
YFIVRDAGHADPTIALNALREIARRESAAALSPSSARYVADALLKKLGRKTALSMIACDLLSDFETTDRLTDAQRREYFTRAVRINLVARSPVISGRSVPVKIEFQSDLPRGRYAFRGELGAFDLGESSRPSVMPHFSGEYVSGMRDHDAVLAAPPDPGTHIVTARLKFSIHRAKHSGSKRSSSPIPNEFGPAIFDAEPELTASVEVRDPDDENPVKKIHDPLLACEMTKAFRPSRLFVRKNPFAEGRHELSGYILIDAPPPAAVAFDVFVRVGEREFQAGNFTRGRGTSGLSEWGFMIDRWTHGTSQPVSVVFRANPQLVEETTDLFEVWVGELLYENVAVADTEPPREPPRLPKIPPGLPPEFRPPGSNP